MKSLYLIVAAMAVFCFANTASAGCDCNGGKCPVRFADIKTVQTERAGTTSNEQATARQPVRNVGKAVAKIKPLRKAAKAAKAILGRERRIERRANRE